MQPLNLQALDYFTQLRAEVLKVFTAAKSEVEGQLRKPRTVTKLHYIIVAMIVLLIWFFEPGPRVVALVELGLRQVPGLFANDVPPIVRGFISIFGFALWVAIVALLSSAAFGYRDKAPAVLWVYSVLLAPALPLLVVIGIALGTGVGAPADDVFIWYVVSTGASLFIWVILLSLLTIFSGSIPQTLFLLLTSVSSGGDKALLPGYERLLRSAIETTGAQINAWSEADLRQVEAITRWKFDGINGRVQAVSFAVGTIGLLGVLALVLSASDIQAALDAVWSGFSGIVTPGQPPPGEGYFIAVGFLVLIVLIAVFYFARSYAELRTLEIVGMICALAREQASAASTAAVSTPMLVASQKARVSGSEALLVFGVMALDLLSRVLGVRRSKP